MMLTDLTFTSNGIRCAAWHVSARSGALARPAGRPCVVMANGFGGTRDTGLLGFAEAFAHAGLDAFVFDYRGFGASEGTPRQDISVRRQRQDYEAAVAAARHLAGVDPNRIALWGTSYSAGHCVVVAVQDRRIAAVVSMTPAMDGFATLLHLMRQGEIGLLLRATANGCRDLARALTKRAPHYVPLVGPPGSSALITAPGAEEGYTALAGPTWRNQACARTSLAVGLNRPTIYASRIGCPILVQVGTNDHVVPPGAARQAAKKAGRWAQLLEYPVDHFDVYEGPWHERVLSDQVEFLSRVFAG
jgi:pimeloyl-ACP methyl ester carboxylesterase